MSEVWEANATWWQDHFTQGVDPEYVEQMLPLAGEWLSGFRRVLDLGCGEGQVARFLTASQAGRGPDLVVGIDQARNQITAATSRGGGPVYLVGDAPDLPLRDGSFDAVVACLVLEHLEDVGRACAEVARVLEVGGRFVLFLNHPFIQTPDSGWIDDQIIDPPEQYWRVGPYLEESYSLVEVDQGVQIGFHHRPLSRYVNAMAGAGLLVEQMIEPAPPPGFVALAPEYEAVTSIPRLLVLVARRFPTPQVARPS